MSPEFAAFRERHQRARDAALIAAAEHLKGAVKAKLQRGYTTGDFVTGTAAASVNTTEPFDDQVGIRAIRIGSNEQYTLYWELGHINLFTRKYERVEHWRHALEEEGPAMAAIYRDTYAAMMEAAA